MKNSLISYAELSFVPHDRPISWKVMAFESYVYVILHLPSTKKKTSPAPKKIQSQNFHTCTLFKTVKKYFPEKFQNISTFILPI